MEPEIETGGDDSLKQIRTFEGDIADTIKKQSESLVSIQRAERAREATYIDETAPPQRGRAVLLALLAILFLFFGGVGAYYAYTKYKERTAPPVLVAPVNQLIPASSVTNIDASTLSRPALISILTDIRSKPRKQGEVEQVELRRGKLATSVPIATADFLTRLATHTPGALIRAFDPIFMLAYWGNPARGALIVKLSSFENAFPGMLDWEANLPADIGPILTSDTLVGLWQDETLENRDVRALKDSEGSTRLLYGYFDSSILIIVGNEDDFRLIVDRLTSQLLTR